MMRCGLRQIGGTAAVLALGVALVAPASLAAAGVAASTATAEATAINLRPSDLPSSVKWSTAPQAALNKATRAAAKTAAACLRAAGAASGDAFGALGQAGGIVLADVRSPQITEKGSIGVPAANSEVLVLNSAAAADKDLAAVARHAAISCLAAQFAADSAAQGGGTKATGSLQGAPHYGDGNHGVHIQLINTGGPLPFKLYNDEYFYVQGPVEVVFSFLNLSSPFNMAWAERAIKAVMGRAAAVAGK